jgi:hypothetical protein
LVPIWLSGPGQTRKKKKNPGINRGQPAEKGREKENPDPDLGFKTSTFKT